MKQPASVWSKVSAANPAIAAPWEKPPMRIRSGAMPAATSELMSAWSMVCDCIVPSSSSSASGDSPWMSAHAGIDAPMLSVTGRDGALGKIHLTCGRVLPKSRVTSVQLPPWSPSPWSQMTDAECTALGGTMIGSIVDAPPLSILSLWILIFWGLLVPVRLHSAAPKKRTRRRSLKCRLDRQCETAREIVRAAPAPAGDARARLVPAATGVRGVSPLER
mmetsp:Transcript_9555/g.23309  ORF Transcript_9555/g.23309 Transcript_9555/m.23309 type:complete len:219 (+) Transcript_9555:490-1146(+)